MAVRDGAKEQSKCVAPRTGDLILIEAEILDMCPDQHTGWWWWWRWLFVVVVVVVLLFVGCLTSQQHASVSRRRICSDNCTCRHTVIGVADQTFYLTQSQCTDTGLTSPSADPKTPGAWQVSHWSTNVFVTDMTRPGKRSTAKAEIKPRDRYHGGRRPSSDDSLHSPTVIPPSPLDKPRNMKRYHRR